MCWIGRDPQGLLIPTPGLAQDIPNPTLCLRALQKPFLSSLSLGAVTTSLGYCPVFNHLLGEKTFPDVQPKYRVPVPLSLPLYDVPFSVCLLIGAVGCPKCPLVLHQWLLPEPGTTEVPSRPPLPRCVGKPGVLCVCSHLSQGCPGMVQGHFVLC